MTARYFAYGSNLKLSRLRERVPGVRSRGSARLNGHRLTLDKPGRDGSGKANLTPHVDGVVWGALYEFDSSGWVDLDRYEPGYERIEVVIEMSTGEHLAAETYIALERTPTRVPMDWYKQLIIEGAREHALPEEYLELLECLPTQTRD